MSASPLKNQSGNVLFMILIAILLLGALTVAIQGTQSTGAHIDRETLLLRLNTVRSYASELERAVTFVIQNGNSESDIRFAHPEAPADYGDLSADTDKRDQVFSREGGGAHYAASPENINDGSTWEFYGHTALPDVGSDAAELIAVLPQVTSDFCDLVNNTIGYDSRPQDTGICLNGGAAQRFDDGTQFDSTPNTTDETSFSIKPSTQGCVECTADSSLHFFHVLMAR